MKQMGTVIEIEKNSAIVAVPRPSACGEHCASCAGGCQARGHLARAENPLGAKPGDRVLLYAPSHAILGSALLVYGLPLILLFAGYGLAYSMAVNTFWSGLSALLGLAVGLCLLRPLDGILAPKPQIVEIIHRNN